MRSGKGKMVKRRREQPSGAGRGGPRVGFKPTDEQRRTVKALAGYGIPQEQICLLVINPDTGKPLDEKTLRKHFEREIMTGVAEINAAVIESLAIMARGAPAVYDAEGRKVREEQLRVPSAAMFWAKTRLGWRERAPSELPNEYDLTKLSQQELDEFERIARKAAGPAALSVSSRAGATTH